MQNRTGFACLPQALKISFFCATGFPVRLAPNNMVETQEYSWWVPLALLQASCARNLRASRNTTLLPALKLLFLCRTPRKMVDGKLTRNHTSGKFHSFQVIVTRGML